MNANELIAFRKRYKWSQAMLAKQLGCSVRSIVNWESGKYKIPTYIALAVSAIAMNLPAYGD